MKCEELVRYDGEWYDANIVDCLLDEKDAEIADLLRQNRELCQALQVMYSEEEYGKLQKEIESLKASAYADSVDAGMRERRLRRALWLARANNAECQFLYWCARFGTESGFTKADIRGYSVNTTRILRTIVEWIEYWKNVKSKCLKKAEEFK